MTSSLAVSTTSPGAPTGIISRKLPVSSTIAPRSTAGSSTARTKLPQPRRSPAVAPSQVYLSTSSPTASNDIGPTPTHAPSLLDFNSVPSRSSRSSPVPRRPSASKTSSRFDSSTRSGISSSLSLDHLAIADTSGRRASGARYIPSRSYINRHGGSNRSSPIPSTEVASTRRPSAGHGISPLPRSTSEPFLDPSTDRPSSSKSSLPPPNSFVTRSRSPSNQNHQPGIRSRTGSFRSESSNSGIRSAPGAPTERATGSTSKTHSRKATPVIAMNADAHSAELPSLPDGTFAGLISLEQPMLGSPMERSSSERAADGDAGPGPQGRVYPEARNRSRRPSAGIAGTEEKAQDRKDSGVRLLGLGIADFGERESTEGDRTIVPEETGTAGQESRSSNRMSGLSSASGGSGTVRSPSLSNGQVGHPQMPFPSEASPQQMCPGAAFVGKDLPITPQKTAIEGADEPPSPTESWGRRPPGISPRTSSISQMHDRQGSHSGSTGIGHRASTSSTSSFSSTRDDSDMSMTANSGALFRRPADRTERPGRDTVIEVPPREGSLSPMPNARPPGPDSGLRGGVKSWSENQSMTSLGIGLLDPLGGLAFNKTYSRQAAASDLNLAWSARTSMDSNIVPGSPTVSWGGSRKSAELLAAGALSPETARGATRSAEAQMDSPRKIRTSASDSFITETSGLVNVRPGGTAAREGRAGLSINVSGASPLPPDSGSRRSTLVHSRSYSQPETPTKPRRSASSSSSTDETAALEPMTSTGSNRLSKRAHLIKEICTTERAYAKDLALVRDAYLYRLRPSSQHSTVSTALTNGQLSPSSRTSTFTVDTAATSQTSFFLELGGKATAPWPSNSAEKTAGSFTVSSRPPSLHSGQISTYSGPVPPATGNLIGRARSSSKSGAMLSAIDVKAIFLNLEQLAAFAEELATAFEQAAGDGSGGEPLTSGQADAVIVDSLGRVFLDAVPRMTALYTVYCARQSQANDRLHELQKNPVFANYFRDCWAVVQPHTNAWDLGSMLIKPVQRVLKYPLLFGDLLRNTSPVHPDYFHLRKSATAARDIGDEINEVKRRKDVVDKALGNGRAVKVATGTQTDAGARKTSGPNLSFGFGKKLRDKIKDRTQSGNASSVVAHGGITATSDAQLKSLIRRMAEADRMVRRVGQDVNSLPDLVHQVWLSQHALLETWVKVAALQPSDLAGQAEERMEMYRLLITEILAEPVRILHQDIRNSILPAFSTLLQLGINPRALISKLQAQEGDYHRVIAASRKKSDEKHLDAHTKDAAQEYTALHNQLLEELPPYLSGYGKILQMTVLAFARAQADFHQAVRTRHRAFVLAVNGEELPVAGDFDVLKADVEVMDGRGIVKNWHNAWKPFNDMLDDMPIAQGTILPRMGPSPASSLLRSNSAQVSRPSSSHSRLTVPDHTPDSSNASGTPGLEREPSTGSRGGQLGRLRSSSLVQSLTPTANGGRPASSGSSTDVGALADFGPSTIEGEQRGNGRLGRPFSYLPPLAVPDAIILPEMHPSPILGGGPGNGNSALSWGAESALYRCVCVATFRLDIEIWYAGLRFLSIKEGDAIDILHEVGRVDSLIDLPIDVGVADDGLLVGRATTGDVGLVLCSFLTPVQE